MKRYVSGVTPSLQRNLTLDHEEMLACLFRWVALLSRRLWLPFKDINKLAAELRQEVNELDDLVINLLRENERERKIFFIQFIGNHRWDGGINLSGLCRPISASLWKWTVRSSFPIW